MFGALDWGDEFPPPPELDFFDREQAQQDLIEWQRQVQFEFDEWVTQTQNDFQAWVDNQLSWASDALELTPDDEWGTDIIDGVTTVPSASDVPDTHMLRRTIFSTRDEALAWLSAIGVMGYDPYIVKAGLGWKVALPKR